VRTVPVGELESSLQLIYKDDRPPGLCSGCVFSEHEGTFCEALQMPADIAYVDCVSTIEQIGEYIDMHLKMKGSNQTMEDYKKGAQKRAEENREKEDNT